VEVAAVALFPENILTSFYFCENFGPRVYNSTVLTDVDIYVGIRSINFARQFQEQNRCRILNF
jgi:hypothetical protein